MILQDTYTLASGMRIPKLGFGTWLVNEEQCTDIVLEAIGLGYRLIDTAQAYGNEAQVGKAVRESGVPRADIFVTSKVRAEYKTYDETAASIDESLGKLGLEYIDLMLIHSPQPWAEWRGPRRYFEENVEVWRALEDALRDTKVHAIGVSNFLTDDIENLLGNCKQKPQVNQFMLHIGSTPMQLLEFCKRQQILPQAYAPFGHGHVLDSDVVVQMAKKYDVSPAQLCIAYCIDCGAGVVAKASTKEHMQANADLGFAISQEDMDVLQQFVLETDYGKSAQFPVFSGRRQVGA